MLTQSQLISIILAPIVTGCISFIASLTLITTILRSNLKLSTVYRRLIFGISVADLVQSISQATSSAPMPAGSVWGAIGNDLTCELQGFFTILGAIGAMLYSLSLCIYFLLVVKFEMSELKIKTRVEPFLHAFPILYALVCAIYTYANQNFAPAGTNCWINDNPPNCEADPDVDCISTGNTSVIRWVAIAGPFFSSFVASVLIMGMIWHSLYSQTKRSQSYHQSSLVQPRVTITTLDTEKARKPGLFTSCTSCTKCFDGKKSGHAAQVPFSPLAARLSRPSRASVQRLRDVSKRASAYIIGYLATYFFSLVYRMIDTYGGGPAAVPFFVIFGSRFTFPLQGFFNVLIYTYPHVISCRRDHPEYSWIRCFITVVKHGGDSDQLRTTRRHRRDSMRKQRKLLEATSRTKRCHASTQDTARRLDSSGFELKERRAQRNTPGEECKEDIA
jgi:hypothetical protein